MFCICSPMSPLVKHSGDIKVIFLKGDAQRSAWRLVFVEDTAGHGLITATVRRGETPASLISFKNNARFSAALLAGCSASKGRRTPSLPPSLSVTWRRNCAFTGFIQKSPTPLYVHTNKLLNSPRFPVWPLHPLKLPLILRRYCGCIHE